LRLADERLFESLVSQAQAERRAGDRQHSLELLTEAAKMWPTARLRQEAIQTITMSGVRFLRQLPNGYDGAPDSKVFGPIFSSDGNLVAFINERPVLQVRDFRSGKLLAWRSARFTALRFRPTTSHLAIAKDTDPPVTCLWDPISGKDLGTYQGTNPVFSATGAFMATATGKRVRIWNLANGVEARSPPSGTPLQFLSERELLVTDNGSYRRWDFTLGQETFATPKGVRGMALSANGRLAVLYGRPADRTREAIVVWDLIEGKQADKLPDLGFVPSSVTFSSDGKQLALEDSSGKRLTILVWDLATRSLINRLSSRGLQSSQGSWSDWHTWGYPPPSFSPDGAFLVARGVRGGRYVLCLWDIETGAEVKALPQIIYFWWREQGRVLLTLGASIDQSNFFVGTGNPDGTIYLPDKTGKTPPYLPSGHLNLWEIGHTTPVYQLGSSIQTCSFNKNGSRLAVNDILWEVRTNAEGYSLRRSAFPMDGLFPEFLGRDELWAVSFKSANQAYATLWQLAPRKGKVELPRPSFPEVDKQIKGGRRKPFVPAQDFRATRAAFSPNGKVVLIGSYLSLDGEKADPLAACPLELWDMGAKQLLKRWNQDSYANEKDPNGEEWWVLQFSPDGKRVVTSSRHGVKIWNVAHGKVERILFDAKSHGSSRWPTVGQLAFSQDGKRVLTVASGTLPIESQLTGKGSGLSWATVFAVETGEELRSWEAPQREGGWRSSALNPDGTRVASGGEDGMIRLWEVASGRELARWQGHEAGVSALRFHPDGKTIVSGSKDGTIKLWNLPMMGKELAVLGLDWG
jgi:WD40 repeat protein